MSTTDDRESAEVKQSDAEVAEKPESTDAPKQPDEKQAVEKQTVDPEDAPAQETEAAQTAVEPKQTVDEEQSADPAFEPLRGVGPEFPEQLPLKPNWVTEEIEVPEYFGRRWLSPRQSMCCGAVLGAAIGDAMGHPTEFIGSFEAIRDKYGDEGVTGFELYWERGDRRFAPYTDDTQMAEVVLRALIEGKMEHEHDDLDSAMRRIGDGFIHWAEQPQGGHRAPGNACLSGCRALKQRVHWSEAGGARAGGCGSVMRAYPFGLVFADDLQRAERWSVAHSKLTHRDPIALAGSAAMAVGMALVIQNRSVDYVLSEMVAAACRYCAKTASMMAEAIHEARNGVGPETTLQRLQGWAAHEAIAAAVYLFARHPDDPAAAILEGANTPGDSDSLATLAGALVGGRCGLDSLPPSWVDDVERTEQLHALALHIEL